MLMRLCPHCGRPVAAGSKCTCRASALAEAERQKRYDRTKRNKSSASFYRSVEWDRMRNEIMTRANGLDEVAKHYGRAKPAFLVHHIIPYTEAPERGLDPLNLVCVSVITHASIHRNYRDGKKAKADMQRLLFQIAREREERAGNK